jgi:adenylylsulfate reductase subunit A
MSLTELTCDVLVIGGGLAGTNAAIAAAECGAQVIVAEKGCLERSGDVGGGVDHFLAYLNSGKKWDTKDAFLQYVERVGQGSTDIDVIESVYCTELSASLERLERIGVPMRLNGKDYYRTRGMGQPGAYYINFRGKRLKPLLASTVRSLGCRVLDRLMMLRLLQYDGEIIGGLGMHTRNGNFFVVRAKSTIISTGNTNRLFANPRLNPFNSWLCPYDTGDGQRMAIEAGARLSNMEYMRMTLMPKGFSSAGYNAMVSMGGRFLNGLGDYYMEKAHPMGNLAPRNVVLHHSMEEQREGHGPLYLDCTKIPESELNHLVTILSYEKDSIPDYFAQRGEDPKVHPIELDVSEGMQAGPTEVTGSGLKIDAQSACSLSGLFACGDAADHNRSVHGAVAGGYHAGKHAALAARKRSQPPPISVSKDEFALLHAPLARKTGYRYTQFEDALRKIMSEYAGPTRSAATLQTALRKIEKLESTFHWVEAADIHELARTHESQSLFAVSKALIHAALARKESRFSPFHFRSDFPQPDDVSWYGMMEIWKNNQTMHTVFVPRIKHYRD